MIENYVDVRQYAKGNQQGVDDDDFMLRMSRWRSSCLSHKTTMPDGSQLHPALLIDPSSEALLQKEGAVDVVVVDRVAYRWLVGTSVRVVMSVDEEIGPENPNAGGELVALKAARVTELQDSIRFYVDAGIHPKEREALAALLQKTTVMRQLGVPVDGGASLVLAVTLQWCEEAMVQGAKVAAAVEACTTVKELQKLSIDVPALLGPPPIVRAGEVAEALRAGAAG